VDNFGVKYVGTQHANHLFNALEEHSKAATDWDSALYCGVKLDWDYEASTVNLSMPGYVKAALHKFQHPSPKQRCHAPSQWNIPKCGAKLQLTAPIDLTPAMSAAQILNLQQVVGTFLFYARAFDPTMLYAFNALAAAQSKGMPVTAKALVHLLNYCATHPDAKIQYRASDMILHIHSDASYLTEAESRSRAGGHHFLGDTPSNQTTTPNGPILNIAKILRNVMSLAAEAEVGTLFLNAKEGTVLRTTLSEMGHPQPPILLQTDNSTADGIINGTVKQQRSKAIDTMQFYWVRDCSNQGHFNVFWVPGRDNLGDYFTKHHPPSHHCTMHPVFLHEKNAPEPRFLRGCVNFPKVTRKPNHLADVPSARQQTSHQLNRKPMRQN
jgi:hypothetical protein